MKVSDELLPKRNWRLKLPDVQTLTIALTSVCGSNGHSGYQVTVIDREPNIFDSTFPREMVTCQIDDSIRLRLFCKYDASWNHKVFGHRGDLAYEAEVYRQVLQPSDISMPTFYGAYKDVRTGKTWLLLEYLDRCAHVTKSSDPDAMKQAGLRRSFKNLSSNTGSGDGLTVRQAIFKRCSTLLDFTGFFAGWMIDRSRLPD